MERPKGERAPITREVTGEIVYLDDMRQKNLEAKEYPNDLSDQEVEQYEARAADFRQRGDRPAIMDEYERRDTAADALKLSCVALAEALHALRKPGTRLSYESIAVENTPQEVLGMVQESGAVKLLKPDDLQLAFESDGSHYPKLDVKKQDATLSGVSLTVFGWSSPKVVFTNDENEPYEYPRDYLAYPSNEESRTYELRLSFLYEHPGANFTESILLSIGDITNSSLSLSSNVWISEYAEMGYEGHMGERLEDATDEDLAGFADIIAKIVGDIPKATWQCVERLSSQG